MSHVKVIPSWCKKKIGRLSVLWSDTFPAGVNRSLISWYETGISMNPPFLTSARDACETSIHMQLWHGLHAISMSREWTEHPNVSQGLFIFPADNAQNISCKCDIHMVIQMRDATIYEEINVDTNGLWHYNIWHLSSLENISGVLN